MRGATALILSQEAIPMSTVHYSDLGLVNTREMFKQAVDGGYAIRNNFV